MSDKSLKIGVTSDTQGLTKPTDSDEAPYEVYECHIDLDLAGFEHKEAEGDEDEEGDEEEAEEGPEGGEGDDRR